MAVKLGKVSTKKTKTKAEEAFYEPKLNPNKRRTTPSPKMTSEKYFHLFLKEQPDIVAIYGLDKHTENLIETAWKKWCPRADSNHRHADFHRRCRYKLMIDFKGFAVLKTYYINGHKLSQCNVKYS